MRSSVVLAIALAAAPVGAQVLEPPAAMEASLAPGAFEEMCFELRAGQSIRYAFDAGAVLDFNIHWHRGHEVVYPVRSPAVARLGGSFRSAEKQAYCLMWINHGRAPVPLRARLDQGDG